MVDRYVLDLHAMLRELHRVLTPGGKAVLVVGNSTVRGVFIKNAAAVQSAAELVGLELIDEVERSLPPNRRYLPPPSEPGTSGLNRRMRTESVVEFSRP